jgi:hypothetical protein
MRTWFILKIISFTFNKQCFHQMSYIVFSCLSFFCVAPNISLQRRKCNFSPKYQCLYLEVILIFNSENTLLFKRDATIDYKVGAWKYILMNKQPNTKWLHFQSWWNTLEKQKRRKTCSSVGIILNQGHKSIWVQPIYWKLEWLV